MANYSIKDIERLSGIRAHTIRIWEKRYGLVEPQRSETNIRLYSDEDLKKILNVSILNRHGIKISRIMIMTEDEMKERVNIISHDSSDYDSLIENLVITMVNMDKSQFDTIISRTILQIGFEETVLKVIYPFLDKVGILWVTGSINPAQEHFISNLIRQKLVVAIDSLIPKQVADPKHFLLFLPEGELHELGLLFYSYIIQKRGHKVTYLGQWVPLADMMNATSVLDIHYLLTSIVSVFTTSELKAYLNKLSTSYPGKTIFISGRQAADAGNELPSNIIRLDSVEDFLEFVS